MTRYLHSLGFVPGAALQIAAPGCASGLMSLANRDGARSAVASSSRQLYACTRGKTVAPLASNLISEAVHLAAVRHAGASTPRTPGSVTRALVGWPTETMTAASQ